MPFQRLLIQQAIPYAIAAMVLLGAASAAQAQAGAACVLGGTADEAAACSVKAFQEADSAMHIHYGDVMRILSAHERPLLRKDQSDWQRTSQRACSGHERRAGQDPNWQQAFYACRIQQIEARRKALNHWLHHGAAPDAQ